MITLKLARSEDLPEFKKQLQTSFALAVTEEEGTQVLAEPIPPDEDIETSLNTEGAAAFHLMKGNEKVGGAIVAINTLTQRNALHFFFIKVDEIGKGYGYKGWKAIEEAFPNTRIWETYTPYFEKRNIHFYVNKCGFKITAFYNSHYTNAQHPEDDEMFKFEKEM